MPASFRRPQLPKKTTTPTETFSLEQLILHTPNTVAQTKVAKIPKKKLSTGVGSENHSGSVDDGGYA